MEGTAGSAGERPLVGQVKQFNVRRVRVHEEMLVGMWDAGQLERLGSHHLEARLAAVGMSEFLEGQFLGRPAGGMDAQAGAPGGCL